jgi:hypothetical protein
MFGGRTFYPFSFLSLFATFPFRPVFPCLAVNSRAIAFCCANIIHPQAHKRQMEMTFVSFPNSRQAPPRNVVCVIDAPSCMHHPVSYPAEHHALFRKLVVVLGLVHARSILEVDRIVKTQTLGAPQRVSLHPLLMPPPSDPVPSLAREDIRKFLQQDFLQDDVFEQYVRGNAPKHEWKFLLSIPAHLRYRVGDLAIVHYEAWKWLQENNKELSSVIHPAAWVLDAVPLVRKAWNQPDKPRNNSKYKDTDLYKPLFRPHNLGNPDLAQMRGLPEKQPTFLYCLPNDKVMMQVVPRGLQSVMALSLAASWHISIDKHSPVTRHLFEKQEDAAAETPASHS